MPKVKVCFFQFLKHEKKAAWLLYEQEIRIPLVYPMGSMGLAYFLNGFRASTSVSWINPQVSLVQIAMIVEVWEEDVDFKVVVDWN